VSEATAERLIVDVCVIGGGPAGSTAAGRLAGMGHAVALLEAREFPRPHIGASLPPSIFPLLEQVGVLDTIERAGFVRAESPIVKWPDLRHGPPIKVSPPGLHIDRGRFDQILLDYARTRGVRVFEAAWAVTPRKCPETGRWTTAVRGRNAGFEVTSRTVIDASARQTKASCGHRFSVPTVAVYGYWGRSNGAGLAGRLEAGEAEWMWYAPVSHSQAIAAVFLDPKRLFHLDRRGVAHLYRTLLARSTLISPYVKHAGGEVVHVCDATSRASPTHATRDLIRVGDASLKLDPLSSQGIQTAIAAAIQAAIVCNTILVRPSSADAAVSFYEARQSERLEQHRIKAGQIYGEVASKRDNPFWKLRACSQAREESPAVPRESLTAMTRIALAPDVTFETVPVIDQNLVLSRAAICTSAMKRPVAYLGGIDLVSILKTVKLNGYAHEAVQDLSRRVPEDFGWSMLRWLWDKRIIVSHGQDYNLASASSTLNGRPA
jgi:flavin-dependent dehydrogenase